MNETQHIEKKSLKLLSKPSPDYNEIVLQCVSFANSQGGKLLIGIEDQENIPPAGQRIDTSYIDTLRKYIQGHSYNVGIASIEIIKASNNAEYLEIQIFPSNQTIASTSDGKYYMRISDECRIILPDQIARLASEKTSYSWELQGIKRIPKNRYDREKLVSFLAGIRTSEKVSSFIKEKSEDELLEYYFFVKDGFLTNLGILWIGLREDRASLRYAPSIQFIKYDEQDRKIKKIVFDDFSLNPLELLEAIITLEEWNESIEITSGLFRNYIPIYDREIVREILANALVHRSYVMQGDIFINLYIDRLEIHSPGLLPLGVTPTNILHQSVKRNVHLAKVFYDLKLMEGEGSGYDKVYERLLIDGKKLPEIQEQYDRVTVIIYGKIFNLNALRLIEKINNDYTLKQKELIALGIIAQNVSITAFDLKKTLSLKSDEDTQKWISNLLEQNLVLSKGRTKGKEYFINPQLLRDFKYQGKTSLKKIENHRLNELLLADLKDFPNSYINEIHSRIGLELPRRRIRNHLSELALNNLIVKIGKTKSTKYKLK